MDLASKRNFENQMAAAMAKLKGPEAAPGDAPVSEPTPSPTPPEPTEAAPAETPEAPDVPETEAPQNDEWIELKNQFGTPTALREHLENQRAMQTEAHRRNEESRYLNEQTRQMQQQTEQLAAQQRAQIDAMTQMGEADPVAAQQLFTAIGRQRNTSTQAVVGPEVAQLQASIARLEQAQRSQQFAHNQAITVSAANEAIARSEVLSSLAQVDKDLAQEAAQELVQKLYDLDMRSPGTVVPTNSVTFRPQVEDALRKVERKYKAIGEGHIKAWKAKHAANAAKAPPSGKGPSASGRTVPQEVKRPSNMNIRQAGDFFERELKRAIASQKNGSR